MIGGDGSQGDTVSDGLTDRIGFLHAVRPGDDGGPATDPSGPYAEKTEALDARTARPARRAKGVEARQHAEIYGRSGRLGGRGDGADGRREDPDQPRRLSSEDEDKHDLKREDDPATRQTVKVKE